jgi:hypothetical protein
LNAQDTYNKAKWKAIVQPPGTTASIYQMMSACGGDVEITLTAIGTADLDNIADGEEFWVEAKGASGPFTIGIRHNDDPQPILADWCCAEKQGNVFAFALQLDPDDLNDWSTQIPDPDSTISISEPNGSVSAPNTGDPNNKSTKGASVTKSYKVKAVTDIIAGTGLKVQAKAHVTYSSSGTMKILNAEYSPSLSLGLSASWGTVTLSIPSIPLASLGRSAGGTKITGQIGDCQVEGDQQDKNDSDVGRSPDIPIEKSFTISPSAGVSDIERTYTLGTTEIEVKSRVDCVSAVQPGFIFAAPIIDNQVLINNQTMNTPAIIEMDGIFELIP